MPALVRLCSAADIADGQAKSFDFGDGAARESIFVIRRAGRILAYRNHCPHIGSPLDWPEGQFFNADASHLLCHTHGALFRPEDGLCVRGPCRGKALTSAPIKTIDGILYYG